MDETIISSLAGGLVGALVGAFATGQWQAKQAEITRQLTFVETQVRRFYNPVLARFEHAKALQRLFIQANEAALTFSVTGDVSKETAFSMGKSVALYAGPNVEKQKQCYREILDLFRNERHLVEELTDEDFDVIVKFTEFFEICAVDDYEPTAALQFVQDPKNFDALYEKVKRGLAEKRKILNFGDPMINTKPKLE